MRVVATIAAMLALGCCRVPPTNGGDHRAPTGEPLASTQVAMGLLVTDRWLYWTEVDGLVRIAKNGGSPTKLKTGRLMPSLFLENSGVTYCTDGESRVRAWRGLAVDKSFANVDIHAQGGAFWDAEFFWTTEDGEVKRADTDSWTATTLATGQSQPMTVVADRDHVYWTNQGDDTASPLDTHDPRNGAGLMRVPHGGGAVELMAKCTGYCWDLVATPTGVLFADFATGNVVRVDKRSRRRTVVASGQKDVRALEVDGTTAYWAVEGGRILRVPERGGRPEVVATGVEVRDLAVDDSYVYWLDADRPKGTGTLRKIRK